MVASDQVKYEWVGSRLPLRGSADAIALRFETATADDGVTVSAQYVGYAARGGTVIHIEGWGEKLTDAVFAQIVSEAAARLDRVVG
ncbi:hypothetical protein ACFV9C_40580 [Kribbella sp. NPDC059898]|uniref:hypothetical protein n=1 Tax=Kribbella sp. NPDC059898 TaxID=3346995 RepID=UPI00365F4A7A